MNTISQIVNICLLLLVIFTFGCGVVSKYDDIGDPDQIFFLKNSSQYVQNVALNTRVAIDVGAPVEGDILIGASFDPDVLNLLHFLEYDDGDIRRLRYVFKARGIGSTAIKIKTAPEQSGAVQIYRQVTITVSSGQGVF